jgi:hypothetical protein
VPRFHPSPGGPGAELVKVERGELDFSRHQDLLFEDETMTKLRPQGQIVA